MNGLIETICELKWRFTAVPDQIEPALKKVTSPQYYHGLCWKDKVQSFARLFRMREIICNEYDTIEAVKKFEAKCRDNYGVPYLKNALQYCADNMIPPPQSMCKDFFLFFFYYFFFIRTFFFVRVLVVIGSKQKNKKKYKKQKTRNR